MLSEVSKYELSLMMRLFIWLMFMSITGVLENDNVFNATCSKILNLDINFFLKILSKNFDSSKFVLVRPVPNFVSWLKL